MKSSSVPKAGVEKLVHFSHMSYLISYTWNSLEKSVMSIANTFVNSCTLHETELIVICVCLVNPKTFRMEMLCKFFWLETSTPPGI